VDDISYHIPKLLEANERHTKGYLKANRTAQQKLPKNIVASRSVREYSNKVSEEAAEFAEEHRKHAKEASDLVDKLKKVRESGGTLTDEHKKQIEDFMKRSKDLLKRSASAEYQTSVPENNHSPSAPSDEHHNLYNHFEGAPGQHTTHVHPDAQGIIHPDNVKRQRNPIPGPKRKL
jgi:hypothetical protein